MSMENKFSDVKSESEAESLGRLYPIILKEYDENYPKAYEREKDFLLELFGDAVLRINHIGSTAVPNLISKPTIDILVEIKPNTNLSLISEMLVRCGYNINMPKSDIITYIKGYGKKGFVGQVYHIHVREYADHNELYFRDYIISHPEAAKEYGELKLSLKQKFEHDRDAYTFAKSDFIEKITKLARAELGNKYAPKKDGFIQL